MKKIGFIFLLICSPLVFGQEICDDAIDNDGDGLIDLEDPDCDCAGFGLSYAPSSLIPNPSFEDHTCCPTAVSMLYCANGWIQASDATSDYLHTCMGFTSLIPFDDPALPPPGGGDGYAGFHNSGTYKEYIGACLSGPMTAGTCYMLDLWVANSTGSPDITLTLYGTPNCSDLPWTGYACPIGSGSWEVLASQFVSCDPHPGSEWTEVTLSFTPTVDINAVAIGGSCTSVPGMNYFFVDDLVLAACSAFSGGAISQTGNWCDGDLMLTANIDTTGGAWQWYQDSIALVGETANTLDLMSYGPGNYTAVYTIGGDCDAQSITVVIPDAPVADFTFSDQCMGVSVPFTDASTISSGAIVSWDWDFGDGGTSTTEDPSYTYSSPGTYTVSLTVTSDSGCTHTQTHDITINPNPSVDFTVPDVCFNETSTFTDATSGATISSWAWDFDDGSTSSSENPTHVYAAGGTYSVTLVATSDAGCVDSVTHTHNVTSLPTADFTTSDDCVYNDAAFTDASTISPGTITGWAWDFGDGGTSTTADPSHTYSTAGTYTVELIVFAGSSVCSDTIQQLITMHPTPAADFTVSNVCFGDPASFTDASTVSAPDAITSWFWDFDDAASSSTASPTHAYATAGTYNVTLTATSDFGCTNSVTLPVTVYEPPVADFTSTSVCENQPPTVFTDLSSTALGTITSWSWDFGDGGSSSVENPVHNYGSGGTFMATLTVTTDQGCTNTVNYSVQVWEKPIAQFTSDATMICNPGCINFTSLATSPTLAITGWDWDFENSNSVSGTPNPTPCFTNPLSTEDYFDVSLIATNEKGCKDTISVADYVTVVPTPIAQFGFSPSLLTITEPTVEFNNSSKMADSYVWDFGDGSPTSSVTDPTHDYPEIPQHYLVELDAYSAGGLCKDSTTQLIIVEDVIIFYVPNVFTPDGDEYNQTFQPVFYSGYDPYDFHMTIYNRWGEIVFETYNASIGWDGTYGSRGLVEDGTYIWQIEFKETMSDKHHKHRGHVTILK